MNNSTFYWQFSLVRGEKGTNKKGAVFVLIITIMTMSLLACDIANTAMSVYECVLHRAACKALLRNACIKDVSKSATWTWHGEHLHNGMKSFCLVETNVLNFLCVNYFFNRRWTQASYSYSASKYQGGRRGLCYSVLQCHWSASSSHPLVWQAWIDNQPSVSSP